MQLSFKHAYWKRPLVCHFSVLSMPFHTNTDRCHDHVPKRDDSGQSWGGHWEICHRKLDTTEMISTLTAAHYRSGNHMCTHQHLEMEFQLCNVNTWFPFWPDFVSVALCYEPHQPFTLNILYLIILIMLDHFTYNFEK